MPSLAIEPPPVVTLPIAGSDAVFPVRRVYCIGRNYAAHTVEMGGDPDREAPFFFQKNPDNLDPSGEFPTLRILPTYTTRPSWRSCCGREA